LASSVIPLSVNVPDAENFEICPVVPEPSMSDPSHTLESISSVARLPPELTTTVLDVPVVTPSNWTTC